MKEKKKEQRAILNDIRAISDYVEELPHDTEDAPIIDDIENLLTQVENKIKEYFHDRGY